jgi:hypothetical protein
MPDHVENLNASIAGCQHEASVQAESAAALDAKLLGILAFMVSVTGLLLALKNGLASYRWILLVGAGGSIVLTLLGLVTAEDTQAGPNPIIFYKKYGGAEPADFSKQLIADFDPMLRENKSRVEMRRNILSNSFGWAASAGVIFVLVRALVAILS